MKLFHKEHIAPILAQKQYEEQLGVLRHVVHFLTSEGWHSRSGNQYLGHSLEYIYNLTKNEKTQFQYSDEFENFAVSCLIHHGGSNARRKSKTEEGQRPNWHHHMILFCLLWLGGGDLEDTLAGLFHDDIEDMPKLARDRNKRIPTCEEIARRIRRWLMGSDMELQVAMIRRVVACVKTLTNPESLSGNINKRVWQIEHMSEKTDRGQKLKCLDILASMAEDALGFGAMCKPKELRARRLVEDRLMLVAAGKNVTPLMWQIFAYLAHKIYTRYRLSSIEI